ncbi:MAG TPA: M20/M25/M40 family metallo-hydrolase, partial [Longimicrobiales bacterium]|nr:M20/M25/M40 family metallo-hydrolase [Longimicrobiales bacterium]
VGVTEDAARELFAAAGSDLDALRAGEDDSATEAVFDIASEPAVETVTPPNVVAMRRGSDPALAGTYVVLTAHFDHVGVGAPDETGDSIYNGADDNASGTAGLMEVAEAFAALPEAPARSVIFLAVSGEEGGLLGSMAFAENPTVPMDSIITNVNMDMIGRNAPDTVIGIGQEYSSLQDVLQGITTERPELGLNVVLDQKPEEMLFFRSDQLAFIQKGVPAVFFTTDLHEDYHAPSDEPAKIDNDKASRVARLAFYLAHRVAGDAVAPDWTAEGRQRVEQMLEGSPF